MLTFLKALFVLVGTIIGVGIFGLPYVASKAGFFVTIFYLFSMTAIVIIVHLLLGEVSLGTKEFHRLPGYAGLYLGNFWKKISLLIFGFGLIGALLAYLIVGGEFLNFFLSPFIGGNSLIYTILFFAAGSWLVFVGIRRIAQIEILLSAVFFSILIMFFLKALPFLQVDYFKKIDWNFFTFPYGPILFSLWGTAVIPEIKEMLAGDRKSLKKAIILGTLIASLTYFLFILTVFGASGPNTSKEGIAGLAFTLGDNIIRLGFLFGAITCFDSFFLLGLTLKKVLWYDFGLSKNFSWFIACFLPLFLFLIGIKEFIEVIGFTGALAMGGEGIIIIFLYREFLEKKLSRKMNPLVYLLPALFVLGIILAVFYFVFK